MSVSSVRGLQQRLEGLASVVEVGPRGPLRDAQDISDLPVAVPLQVEQRDGGPLHLRQPRQRLEDPLAAHAPLRLALRVRVAARPDRDLVVRAQLLPPDQVQAGAPQDPVEPGPEGTAGREVVDPLQGADEGVLHRVLGVRSIPDDADRHGVRLVDVTLHEPTVRRPVPFLDRAHELRLLGVRTGRAVVHRLFTVILNTLRR